MPTIPDSFKSKPWGVKVGGVVWKAYIPQEAEDDWYILLSNAANVQRMETEVQRLQAELEAAIERKEEVQRQAGRQIATEKHLAELQAKAAQSVIKNQSDQIEYLRTQIHLIRVAIQKLTAFYVTASISPAPTPNLTLATLTDMVLGEDAPDRSEEALLRAVRVLLARVDQLARTQQALDEMTQRALAGYERLTADVVLIDGKHYHVMSDGDCAKFIWNTSHA